MKRATISMVVGTLLLILAAGTAVAAVVDCVGGDCFGTPDNDTLNGSAREDFIHGLGGADVVSGLGSNDVLYAYSGVFDFSGGGDDRLRGGEGSDRLYGDSGNDTLYGDLGDDELLGTGGGDDTVVGGGGADHVAANWVGSHDVVAGGDGEDFIEATDQTKDVVDCGTGRDRVLFDERLDKIRRCEIKNR